MSGAGLLWQMDTHRSLEQNVQEAADRYQRHFGQTPNLIELHPSVTPPALPGFTVRQVIRRQKGHLWISRETADLN